MRCVLAIIWDKASIGEVIYELPEQELIQQLLSAFVAVKPKLTLWERVKYIFRPNILLGEKDYRKAIDSILQNFKSKTQKAHLTNEVRRKVLIKKTRTKQTNLEDEGYIIPNEPLELYRTIVGNSQE